MRNGSKSISVCVTSLSTLPPRLDFSPSSFHNECSSPAMLELAFRLHDVQCYLYIKRDENLGGAFGGNRGLSPVPPEKGVFPLDHMHLCDLEKKEYLSCLKTSGHQSEKCRLFSKKYLECRMEKNLMAKQDMSELGFVKEGNSDASGEKVSERIAN